MKSKLYLLYIFLVDIIVILNYTFADCPSPWQLFDDTQSCYIIVDNPIPWQAAIDKCISMDAHLADVTSHNESEFVETLARNQNNTELYQDDSLWLAGNDLDKEGEWRWKTDDSVMNFTDWNLGEPNNYKGKENCLEMYRGLEVLYTWRDADCHLKHKYICEQPIPTDPGFG